MHRCKLLKDKTTTDTEMLIGFIQDKFGGEIGADYADPYGQGRIVIKE